MVQICVLAVVCYATLDLLYAITPPTAARPLHANYGYISRKILAHTNTLFLFHKRKSHTHTDRRAHNSHVFEGGVFDSKSQAERIARHATRTPTIQPQVNECLEAEEPTVMLSLSPKTPHSLKCVVVATTTPVLTSTFEPPSGSVQTPASLLNMKRNDDAAILARGKGDEAANKGGGWWLGKVSREGVRAH